MTAVILAAAKTIEGNPLADRIPKNTTPGAVFTACVVAALILWMVRVWYIHYGPGSTADDADRFA